MEQLLIGTYIRQKRLDKGWTQERLCEGVCNAATLSRIENNERTPSVSVAKALLQKLGLPDGKTGGFGRRRQSLCAAVHIEHEGQHWRAGWAVLP